MKIKFKKLSPQAVIPNYTTTGDAGLDLVAIGIEREDVHKITYTTGISLDLPAGYVGLLFPLSSQRKYSLRMGNNVCLVDPKHKGEIHVTFDKIEDGLLKYRVGERIAQLLILPYPQIELEEII